jgi:hypothetical protein
MPIDPRVTIHDNQPGLQELVLADALFRPEEKVPIDAALCLLL